MKVQKWQACGNDFLVSEDPRFKPYSIYAVKACDRHYGIGADGVLRVDSSAIADCRMTVINASGSEAEMCGNGIRCVAQYVSEKLGGKEIVTVETKAGIKEVRIIEPYRKLEVDMGKATWKWSKTIELQDSVYGKKPKAPKVFKDANFIDIGNPHCVLLVEESETDRGAVSRYGSRLERMIELFPNGTNVEFVTLLGGNEIRVKVWERGVGRTLACGTGACASAYAAYQAGLLGSNKEIKVKLDGGYVHVNVADENSIKLIGPAKRICEGEYESEAEEKK